MPQAETLRQRLERVTRAADPALVRSLDRGRVQCLACGHRCRIPEGHDGICRVRSNVGGTLRVPWGYVAHLAVDPIEKKPFFHAFPGEPALSFGMLGCDLHCGYCQNWITSQALRDPAAGSTIRMLSPDHLVNAAIEHGSRVLVSTYNEPLITAEWALDVFALGHERGLSCAFVSNGNATPEVLDRLRPFVDLYKVDLKGYDDRRYRELGGVLANVLRSLEDLLVRGFWVEVVTLVTPGFNDSDDELRAIARHIAGLRRDVPWHVTGFVPQYRMESTAPTPVATLARARAIGLAEGLRFVYTGNRPGAIEGGEDTHCPDCGNVVIARSGFRVRAMRLRGGCCPDCGTPIPGVWGSS
jgi:pyruvate formate lyase activating enzyme